MQTETLSHRPVVPMPLFDAEQPAQLARVGESIAPLVLAFFTTKQPGDLFTMNSLTDYVRARRSLGVVESAGRILRDLKRKGELNYELVSRAQSLYRVLAVEGVCKNCGKPEPTGLAICEGCGEKFCDQCVTPGHSWGGDGGGNSGDFWCDDCKEVA